jgi:putative phosphoribosyl transferase
MWLFERAAQLVPPAVIERIIQKQGQEISRRIDVLRGGNPLPSIKGRCVVLVDDGIAAGSTMRASIRLCRNQHADKIVVAAPVASSGVKNQLEAFVDEIVILKTPPGFQAVADAYANWYDVSDQEALEIMRRWEREVEARETP